MPASLSASRPLWEHASPGTRLREVSISARQATSLSARLPDVGTWTTIDWVPEDWTAAERTPGPDVAGASRALWKLLHDLEAGEGTGAPLLPSEFGTDLASGAAGRSWYVGDHIVGFGLLRPDGVFRAVLRPEQREMSLFLPMLVWAEATRRDRWPGAVLQVVAQDDDVCLPFLLLRLGFTGAAESWSRADGASTFRLYTGGRLDTE